MTFKCIHTYIHTQNKNGYFNLSFTVLNINKYDCLVTRCKLHIKQTTVLSKLNWI